MSELEHLSDLELLEKSGKILAAVHKYAFGLPVRRRKILDICELVEARIRDLGAQPAFPCNVGVNEVAAHYTSPVGDLSLVPDGSIVKIDFGVSVDGFLTDGAVTLSLNPAYDSMVVAAESALSEAVEAVAPGRKISDIGEVIERAIKRYGYKPVRDLTGHKIERYSLHAGKSVPNVPGGAGKFEAGEVYAIEPFVTLKSASGTIRAAREAYIYQFANAKNAKSQGAIRIAKHIKDTYRSLPFAYRWVLREYADDAGGKAFDELVRAHCLSRYPVLFESSGAVVAQAEHTILVTDNGCKILTQ